MVEGRVYPVDGHFVGVSPRVTSASLPGRSRAGLHRDDTASSAAVHPKCNGEWHDLRRLGHGVWHRPHEIDDGPADTPNFLAVGLMPLLAPPHGSRHLRAANNLSSGPSLGLTVQKLAEADLLFVDPDTMPRLKFASGLRGSKITGRLGSRGTLIGSYRPLWCRIAGRLPIPSGKPGWPTTVAFGIRDRTWPATPVSGLNICSCGECAPLWTNNRFTVSS
jgi:hypothetical protein